MRRILWILVWVAVIAGLGIAFHRVRLEREQTTVELVYDFRALEHLAVQMGADVSDLLDELQQRGVTTIAVAPYTLGEALWYNAEVPTSAKAYAAEHPHELDLLWSMPAVFPESAYAAIAAAGLEAAPRLGNPPWDLPENWRDFNPSLVILGASESPGYPDQLAEYASYFRELGVRVGTVEFTQQRGIQALAPSTQMVRVHGINQRELDSLSSQRVVARYVRAVRERNIRVVYLRPFLSGEEPWQRSLGLLADLTGQLKEAGYSLGKSIPFPEWRIPLYLSGVVWAGIWAAAFLLVGSWLALPDGFLLFGAGFGWIMTAGLALKNLQLAQQGMALMAAVVFPSLAVRVRLGRSALTQFAAISAVSVAGGLLVAGSLVGTDYLVKLAEFRGVKAMHVLPVGIVTLGLLLEPILPVKSWRSLRARLRFFWDLSIPVEFFFVGGAGLVGAMAVYILRTGNFGLPAIQLEVELREFLERVLIVRPRTKEFLIGHPALYFLLKKDRKGWAAWLAPLAVIGQLSMVNTFSHMHTPLLITLYRTAYGLIFGYIIGWITFQLYRLGKGLLASDRGFGVSRLWQSRR
ncbi:MAG: hypothetical protein GX195_04105 [Firmicutes bacterium]|nr:hypothetical protein [Bacillota bacterium]